MNPLAAREIARQYRVAQQTLAMHCDLRDWYSWLGLAVEVGLLVFSVMISATTFSGDDFFKSMRVTPETGRFVLGIISVVAFASSLVLLVLDPRGRSAKHADAATLWTHVVTRFRELRSEDDTWSPDAGRRLSAMYAKTCKNAAQIPDGQFNRLKSRYLRKVEISQLKEKFPGCPLLILRGLVRSRDILGAMKALYRGGTSGGQIDKSPGAPDSDTG